MFPSGLPYCPALRPAELPGINSNLKKVQGSDTSPISQFFIDILRGAPIYFDINKKLIRRVNLPSENVS